MRSKISIVIPVYFNAGSLPALFKSLLQLRDRLAKKSLGTEIIFVDDGSGDESLEILKAFKRDKPFVKVIKLTRNFGADYASRTGLRFVTGDAFTVLPADLQDPPELVDAMLPAWQRGAKFVICERASREDPWLSKVFSGLFYFLLRTLVIPGYPRGGFDAALMDRVMLSPMAGRAKSAYGPLLAFWLGYKPVIIRYHRRAREHGRSRWTFAKKISAFLDVMMGFSILPIRFMSGVGMIISGLSFAYGLDVTVHAILGKIPVAGFASLASLIAFLVGLVLLMLGVIGEYLWRIFDELNRRPETVIEKVW